MENMDKGLTVPKWVLIVWPKIPQMPNKLSVQFVCPSPKVLDFNEKRASLGVHSPWLLSYHTERKNFFLRNWLSPNNVPQHILFVFFINLKDRRGGNLTKNSLQLTTNCSCLIIFKSSRMCHIIYIPVANLPQVNRTQGFMAEISAKKKLNQDKTRFSVLTYNMQPIHTLFTCSKYNMDEICDLKFHLA